MKSLIGNSFPKDKSEDWKRELRCKTKIIHEALEQVLRNTYFNVVFSSIRSMISVCHVQEQMGKSQRLVCASPFPAMVTFTHQHFLGRTVTFGTSVCEFGGVPVFLYLSLRGQEQCQAAQATKYQTAHCERGSLATRKLALGRLSKTGKKPC